MAGCYMLCCAGVLLLGRCRAVLCCGLYSVGPVQAVTECPRLQAGVSIDPASRCSTLSTLIAHTNADTGTCLKLQHHTTPHTGKPAVQAARCVHYTSSKEHALLSYWLITFYFPLPCPRASASLAVTPCHIMHPGLLLLPVPLLGRCGPGSAAAPGATRAGHQGPAQDRTGQQRRWGQKQPVKQ